jgi:hypothetical protein
MFKRSLIAALILVPAIGFAADNTAGTKGPRSAGHFSKADTDGNGTLSRAEVEKAGLKMEQVPKDWHCVWDYLQQAQKPLRDRGMRKIYACGLQIRRSTQMTAISRRSREERAAPGEEST